MTSAARFPLLRFLLIFGGGFVLFHAAAATPWFQQSVLPTYLAMTAQSAAWLLGLGIDGLVVRGTTIYGSAFSIDLRQGCDAIEPAALFAAAAIALPVSWRRRVIGIVSGVAVLQVANVLRTTGLFLIGLWAPSWFQFMHIEVGQAAFVLLTGVGWIIWARWALRARAAGRETA